MKTKITIEKIRRLDQENQHRVEAVVSGVPVWFETTDTVLLPSPEAFVSAYFIPALSTGADLSVEGSLEATFQSNLQKLKAIFQKWWGYPDIVIESLAPTSLASGGRDKTALCFTGGVDSFFSLLRSGHKIDYLVYIYGYDISLRDTKRLAAYQGALEAVARASGAKLVVIRTNLREHPLFVKTNWERMHGGALAAISHLLGDVKKFLISASYPCSHEIAWGSHWQTDPLWVADGFEIVFAGGEFWRSDKLRQIVDEPLVQKYLRVCWENRNENLNCCECEKCLRTMIILAQCRKLERFVTFPAGDHLAERIDHLPKIGTNLVMVYEAFLQTDLPAEVKDAISSLIRRTKVKSIFEKIGFSKVWARVWLVFPLALRQRIKGWLLSSR